MPACLSMRKKRTSMNAAPRAVSARLAAAEEQELLDQVHVLFVLQERAVERRQRLALVGAQRFGRDVLRHQQLDPVEKLRGRGLRLQARHLAQLEERGERLGEQLALQAGEVNIR